MSENKHVNKSFALSLKASFIIGLLSLTLIGCVENPKSRGHDLPPSPPTNRPHGVIIGQKTNFQKAKEFARQTLHSGKRPKQTTVAAEQQPTKPAITTTSNVNNKTSRETMLRQVASQGDMNAQYKLGKLLITKTGTPPNNQSPYYQAGVLWLTKAASQGHPRAINLLSEIKYDLRWLKEAANQGNSNAQYKLGLLYQTGQKDVPYGKNTVNLRQDQKKAMQWLQRAADNGNKSAEEQVAAMMHYQNS